METKEGRALQSKPKKHGRHEPVGLFTRQRQLIDHLLLGEVSRMLCHRRRRRRRMRGSGASPVSLGLFPHCLLYRPQEVRPITSREK